MNDIYVIAEMACSHEGKIDHALQIIDAASASKSDAIQLQIWDLRYMMSPQRKEYDLLKKLEFNREEWISIVDYIKNKHPSLDIYVCVYEHASIEFIDSLGIDGYKINSSDLSNPVVLEKVALTKKPINLSVGASTLSEIQSAIEIIRNKSNSKITLMYGHQSFPTLPENVNMNYMKTLGELFQLPIGYQDHSDADTESAFWLPAASVGMGVTVLEKHITHDRSYKGIDHESALNLDEFIKFVDMVKILTQAAGLSTPRSFSEDEIKYREFQKKSIVAAKNLNTGAILKEEDLMFMRADRLGMPPDKITDLIGKEIKNNITAYNPITLEDII